MKTLYSLGVILTTAVLMPSLFANTTGTGTTSTGTTSTGTTNTGSTSTGTTSTGTTNTGSTSTGSTSTGTTSTGSTSTGTTNTGSGYVCITHSGVQLNIIKAQEVYLTEMTRLLAEKRAAYQSALTLSGTVQMTAIKAANIKFRAGQKVAIAKLHDAKRQNKISRTCKKIEKHESKDDDRDDDKKDKHDEDDDRNDKKEMKGMKKIEKLMQKIGKKSNHRD